MKLYSYITLHTDSSHANQYHKIATYTITSRFSGSNGIIAYYSSTSTGNDNGTHGFIYLSFYQ